MQNQPATISNFPLPPMQYINKYEQKNVQNAPLPPKPLKDDDNFTLFGQNVTPIKPGDTGGWA